MRELAALLSILVVAGQPGGRSARTIGPAEDGPGAVIGVAPSSDASTSHPCRESAGASEPGTKGPAQAAAEQIDQTCISLSRPYEFRLDLPWTDPRNAPWPICGCGVCESIWLDRSIPRSAATSQASPAVPLKRCSKWVVAQGDILGGDEKQLNVTKWSPGSRTLWWFSLPSKKIVRTIREARRNIWSHPGVGVGDQVLLADKEGNVRSYPSGTRLPLRRLLRLENESRGLQANPPFIVFGASDELYLLRHLF